MFELDGEWTYPANWLKRWYWERVPDSNEETIVFFDEATGAMVGFVAWRMWKEKIRGKKEWMGQVHLMGVAPVYQGKGLASAMFATFEAAAIAHEKGSEDMCFRIDVDEGNVDAHSIYEHWGFEDWRVKESSSGARYIQMWRPPADPDEKDSGDAGEGS